MRPPLIVLAFFLTTSAVSQRSFSPLNIRYTQLTSTGVSSSSAAYDSARFSSSITNINLRLPLFQTKDKTFRLAAFIRYARLDMQWENWPDSAYEPEAFEVLSPFMVGSYRLSKSYTLISGTSVGYGKERGTGFTSPTWLFRQIVLVNRKMDPDGKLQLGLGIILHVIEGEQLILPAVRVKYVMTPRTVLQLNLVNLQLKHQLLEKTAVLFQLRPSGAQVGTPSFDQNALGYDKIRQRLAMASVGIEQEIGHFLKTEFEVGTTGAHRIRFFDGENSEVLDLSPARTLQFSVGLKLTLNRAQKSEDDN